MVRKDIFEVKEIEKLLLIYDGDCPACRYYCEGLQVDRGAGKLKLVDFRQDSSWKNSTLSSASPAAYNPISIYDPASVFNPVSLYNPDKAIVFKRGEQVYQGGEALHQLNKVSTHRSIFNRFFSLLFHYSGASRAMYPALRMIRDMWLKITKIVK